MTHYTIETIKEGKIITVIRNKEGATKYMKKHDAEADFALYMKLSPGDQFRIRKTSSVPLSSWKNGEIQKPVINAKSKIDAQTEIEWAKLDKKSVEFKK